VINATEAEVHDRAGRPEEPESGVRGFSSSRVARYEHNMARVYALPAASVALLATLMLRGPQTAAELRAHSERLHRFADISSVEGFLDELAAKEPARVLKLPRAPGAREARWAHLLCGELAIDAAAAVPQEGGAGTSIAAGEIAALKAELTRQADDLARLRQWSQRVAAELGIDPP
jgi:uncharacterized protein YceH (UPF0502 family)